MRKDFAHKKRTVHQIDNSTRYRFSPEEIAAQIEKLSSECIRILTEKYKVSRTLLLAGKTTSTVSFQRVSKKSLRVLNVSITFHITNFSNSMVVAAVYDRPLHLKAEDRLPVPDLSKLESVLTPLLQPYFPKCPTT